MRGKARLSQAGKSGSSGGKRPWSVGAACCGCLFQAKKISASERVNDSAVLPETSTRAIRLEPRRECDEIPMTDQSSERASHENRRRWWEEEGKEMRPAFTSGGEILPSISACQRQASRTLSVPGTSYYLSPVESVSSGTGGDHLIVCSS